MLVTISRSPIGTGASQELGPLDTEQIELGHAIERKVDEIDFFDIDRNLDSRADPLDARHIQVTVETREPDLRIHGVQYAEGNAEAARYGVVALAELIESAGVPFHDVTFDASGHVVPVHPPIECSNWSAWYDHEPGGPADPKLHVAGECTLPVAGVTLSLELGDVGIAPEPGLIALDLKAEFPTGSPQVISTVRVTWDKDVGPDVTRVRIQGAADAELKVTRTE
jgi:hypothetical protein